MRFGRRREQVPGPAHEPWDEDAGDGPGDGGDAGGGDAQDVASGDAREPGGGAAAGPGGPAVAAGPPSGPYDVSDADGAAASSGGLPRIDLGALHLPAVSGMELRLEMEEGARRVVAATVGMGGSTVQVQAFAAPRTDGIWDEVRAEIAASVTTQGGAAEEVDGPFGQELLARVPVRLPDGRSGLRTSRFVGVDGPRWFVRAVFAGQAAVDPAAAAPLEQVVRRAVVVRGTDAMAPRDLLPLRLPAGSAVRPPGRRSAAGGAAAGAPGGGAAGAPGGGADGAPPDRGATGAGGGAPTLEPWPHTAPGPGSSGPSPA